MPTVDVTIELLRADDASVASHVLARAFFDDPLNVWLMPDEQLRAAALPGVFEAIVRGNVRTTWVSADTIVGAASWMPPGVVEMSAEEMAATGFEEALAAMGEDAATRAALAFPYLGSLRARDVPDDHWYLGLLGVEPAQQGLGMGTRLIAPGLALADDAGVPSYLETIKERNVPFYESHGFRVLESGHLPGGGPRFWTLRREASR